MNKVALLTVGKRLDTTNDIYIVSVYDLEPSGVLIHAYNHATSKEYTFPIKEKELAAECFNRTPSSLSVLVETITLESRDDDMYLQSSVEGISRIKRAPREDEVEVLLRMQISDKGESLHDLIVRGLVELNKTKPVGLNAVKWLGEWMLSNNPNKPKVEELHDDE